MKATRLVDIATKSILKNKMRTLLTMLGIIIGVGAVIVMVAVGQGAKGEIQRRIDNLGTNMIVITQAANRQGGVSQGAGSAGRLTIDDYTALKREGLLLSQVSPVVIAPSQVIGGSNNWRSLVDGVSLDYETIRAWTIASGRYFDQTDLQTRRKVAVIGKTVADNLFPGQDAVGALIRIRNEPFQVIGVLAAKGQTAEGTDQDDVILAPYTTVQTRLTGGWTFLPQILASTDNKEDLASAQQEIRQILRDSHKLPSYADDDFTIRNQTDLAEAAQGTTSVMTMLLAAIASISLLVGGIGIMNIMLASVLERTNEIGLRRAIGAKKLDIRMQFMAEAVAISLAGGLIGVGLGYGISRAVAVFSGWSTIITMGSIGLSFGVSSIIGLIFGIYPAVQASNLDPIECLRYE
jgi:putative ABC transport system permease protein